MHFKKKNQNNNSNWRRKNGEIITNDQTGITRQHRWGED